MRHGLTILPEHAWPVAAPMWRAAEDLGFDSVWTAEAWGSDAFGPLAYLAGHPSFDNRLIVSAQSTRET